MTDQVQQETSKAGNAVRVDAERFPGFCLSVYSAVIALVSPQTVTMIRDTVQEAGWQYDETLGYQTLGQTRCALETLNFLGLIFFDDLDGKRYYSRSRSHFEPNTNASSPHAGR